MKNILILCLLLFQFFELSAQLFEKREQQRKLEVAFYPYGSLSEIKDDDYNSYYIGTVSAEATCAYYPQMFKKYLGFGLKADYTHAWSNYLGVKPYGGGGVFTRFYLPFFIKGAFFRGMTAFVEFSFNRVNYAIVNKEFINLDGGFSANLYIVPVGIKLHLFHDLYLNCSAQFMSLDGLPLSAVHIGFIYDFIK